jgi:Lon protease-like protein
MSINRPYTSIEHLPRRIPVFPLPGALLLPRGQLPLNIFEPRYVSMIDAAMAGDRIIGMVQPVNPSGPDVGANTLHEIGCAGRITRIGETGDGRYVLTLDGIARFRILEEIQTATLFRQCLVEFRDFDVDLIDRAGEEAVDRDKVIETLRRFADARDLRVDWTEINRANNELLVNALSMICPFGVKEKQALLEAGDLKTRGDMLVAITELELARGIAPEGTTLLQ